MTKTKVDISELVNRIHQEVMDRTLVLDCPGDEQNLRLDAARVVFQYHLEILGMESKHLPGVVEIDTYSRIYNRALELLK